MGVGEMRHHVLGRRQAAHDGQHHVQSDDVGPELAAHLDRQASVLRLTDDLHAGVVREDLAQVLAHRDRVLHDEHADDIHGLRHVLPDTRQERNLIELALDHVVERADLLTASSVLRRRA